MVYGAKRSSVRTALVLVLAGCGGSMAASNFPAAEVINACKKSESGAIRIVADPAACTADEMPLSWSAAPTAVKQITGVVGPDGSVSIGSGFTTARVALGAYSVDFPGGTWNGETFAVPVVSCYADMPCSAQITSIESGSTGSATFSVLTTIAGAPADRPFTFVITQS